MYQSRIRESKNRGNRKRDLMEPEDGQSFAIVQDMLGNGRVRVLCQDKMVRTGRIRGSMRKYSGKVLIERNDLVVVATRDFDSDTVDVIHKYNQDEIHYMMRHDLLPEVMMKKIQMGDELESKTCGDEYLVFMEGEVQESDVVADGEPGEEEDDLDIDAI